MLPSTDSLIIGFDFSRGKDVGVLIVGRKRLNQTVEIINAFQGKEAEEMYRLLTTVKSKEILNKTIKATSTDDTNKNQT